jgi:hypothetical protein
MGQSRSRTPKLLTLLANPMQPNLLTYCGSVFYVRGKDFISVYPATVPESEWRRGTFIDFLLPAERWSHIFGQAAYNYLDGSPIGESSAKKKRLFGDYLGPYTLFIHKDFNDISRTVHNLRIQQLLEIERVGQDGQLTLELTQRKKEIKQQFYEALISLTFHLVNNSMQAMWIPILDGQWPDNSLSRLDIIEDIQYSLAEAGLDLYLQREQLATEENNYKYFTEENALKRAAVQGLGSEIDSAIVLLEVIKRAMIEDPSLNLIVIPAPLQFEHSTRRKPNPNIDLLVVNLNTREVIGGQVKSKFLLSNRGKYDPERVEIISADVDLENRLERVTGSKAGPKVMTWSGLIGAEIALRPRQYPSLKGTGLHPFSSMPRFYDDYQANQRIPIGNRKLPSRHPGRGNTALKKFIAKRIYATLDADNPHRKRVPEAANRLGRRILPRIGVNPAEDGFFRENFSQRKGVQFTTAVALPRRTPRVGR